LQARPELAAGIVMLSSVVWRGDRPSSNAWLAEAPESVKENRETDCDVVQPLGQPDDKLACPTVSRPSGP
jgi:hypothetical protein